VSEQAAAVLAGVAGSALRFGPCREETSSSRHGDELTHRPVRLTCGVTGLMVPPTGDAPDAFGVFNEALSNRIRYEIFGTPRNATPTGGLVRADRVRDCRDSFADIRLVRAPNQTTLGHRDRLGVLIHEYGAGASEDPDFFTYPPLHLQTATRPSINYLTLTAQNNIYTEKGRCTLLTSLGERACIACYMRRTPSDAGANRGMKVDES
jgi:hypothetical protein